MSGTPQSKRGVELRCSVRDKNPGEVPIPLTPSLSEDIRWTGLGVFVSFIFLYLNLSGHSV